jgi:hypothetical protein
MRHRSDHSINCEAAKLHFEQERNRLKTEQTQIAAASAVKVTQFIATATSVLTLRRNV